VKAVEFKKGPRDVIFKKPGGVNGSRNQSICPEAIKPWFILLDILHE
jgi:hypothetical protein